MSEPNWDEIRVAFLAPFPKDEIGSRTVGGGQRRDYIEARSVMDRLDEVVGPQNWCDAYTVVDGQRMAVECTLSVYGIAKSDVGYPNTEKDVEPYKSAYSDALKRAAVHWGIGRFLYPKASGAAREREEREQPAQDPAPKTCEPEPVPIQEFRTPPADDGKDPQVQRLRASLRQLAEAESSSPLAIMSDYIKERGWKVKPQGLATWPATFKDDFEKEILRRLDSSAVPA